MFACTFTIYRYGHSGTELPPPVVGGFTRTVLSGDESEQVFRERMQRERMDLRALLKRQFEEKPRPYSQADGCDWSITPVGSVTSIVQELRG
jgi:hypothetical protein